MSTNSTQAHQVAHKLLVGTVSGIYWVGYGVGTFQLGVMTSLSDSAARRMYTNANISQQ